MNKLYCTFSSKSDIDSTISYIINSYNILNNRIFILESPQSEEYICTYNIELGNTLKYLLPNTIMVHRKKESNTLYTINALNSLIIKLNNGKLDISYRIIWDNYKNSILLTQENLDFKQLSTTIYKVITII